MKKRSVLIVALGTGQLLCYLFLYALGNLREQSLPCLAGFCAAFFLYAATLYLLRTSWSPPGGNEWISRLSPSFINQKFCLTVVLLLSVCFRLTMLASPPSLSDDIYRYLWEGKLVTAGINPFVHAPDDPSLSPLHDSSVFPHINHKEYLAIYPPLNQFIFALSTIISPTATAMNMTFILFDLLTMALLFLILRERRLDACRIIIYAWNPLIIMEFAGSGHLDSAGIFFLMLALYFFTRKRIWSSALFLSCSFLIKFFPLIFLPFFLTRKRVITLCIFFLTATILYLPFVDAGKKIFGSLFIYSEHWVFNASFYEALLWIGISPLQARKISLILLILIVIVIVIFFRYVQKKSEEQEASIYYVVFIALGALLLLTPTLHPWYLCWMVPFLVIFPNRAWIYFTGSAFLSYFILKGYVERGTWEENNLVKLVEYLPFYAFLLYDAVRRYRAKLSPAILLSVSKAGSSFSSFFPVRKSNE